MSPNIAVVRCIIPSEICFRCRKAHFQGALTEAPWTKAPNTKAAKTKAPRDESPKDPG